MTTPGPSSRPRASRPADAGPEPPAADTPPPRGVGADRSPPGARELDGVLGPLRELAGFPFRLSLETGEGVEVLHDDLAGHGAVARRERSLPGGGRVVLEVEDGTPDAAVDGLERAAVEVLRLAFENRLFVREMAERYEQISLLTSISETLGSVIELERAGGEILQEVVEVTGASRATLWLHRAETNRLSLLVSRGETNPAVRHVDVGDPHSLMARVFRSQRALLVDPGGEGLTPEVREAWEGLGGTALLAVPVTYAAPEGERRRVGVLGLVGRRDDARFSAGDRKLMTAIASQVGAVVENGRLVRESLERERLSAELRMANDLQLKLLPDPRGVRDLAPVAARCEPAESVGGDFYHLIRLSGGRLGVMVGDVSSHGITAALVMAQAMSAAAIVAREEERPADVLRRVQTQLRRELDSTEMYLTLFYGVVAPDGQSLRYASAGHPHAFLLGPDGTRRLDALDLPLGLVEAGAFSEREIDAGPGGATLFVFTDGLFEGGESPRTEAEARLVETAAGAADGGPDGVVDAVFRASGDLRGPARDDRTAVAVRL